MPYTIVIDAGHGGRIRIKDLQYFGSQPWGFSNSIIVGYTAKLDGSDKIHLDTKELAMSLSPFVTATITTGAMAG